MKRIDEECPLGNEPRQVPAICDMHFVRRAILNIEFGCLVFTVIAAADNFMHMLMKAAAQSDVQLLKAAAHAKDGKSLLNRRLQERQRRPIAVFVEQDAI